MTICRDIAVAGQWVQAGLSMVYPPICTFCNRVCQPDRLFPSICRPCLASLPLRHGRQTRLDWNKLALLAGLMLPQERFKPGGTFIHCAARYQGAMRESLLRLKFGDMPELADGIAGLLVQVIRQSGMAYDAVAAVPLHPARLRERGYNQAGLLAGRITSQLEIPDWSGCIVRTRETGRQSALGDRRERSMNMSGAFALRKSSGMSGRDSATVILVDDILTTGATLTAAATPFWQAGYQVAGLVAASEQSPYGD
jgi:ComF family protein